MAMSLRCSSSMISYWLRGLMSPPPPQRLSQQRPLLAKSQALQPPPLPPRSLEPKQPLFGGPAQHKQRTASLQSLLTELEKQAPHRATARAVSRQQVSRAPSGRPSVPALAARRNAGGLYVLFGHTRLLSWFRSLSQKAGWPHQRMGLKQGRRGSAGARSPSVHEQGEEVRRQARLEASLCLWMSRTACKTEQGRKQCSEAVLAPGSKMT